MFLGFLEISSLFRFLKICVYILRLFVTGASGLTSSGLDFRHVRGRGRRLGEPADVVVTGCRSLAAHRYVHRGLWPGAFNSSHATTDVFFR